jgi:glycosyltransferase involved in cell wall biosynthesis
MGIPSNSPVIGFVGRITRDKGICELMEAYERLRVEYPELRLLLVGDFDGSDAIPSHVRRDMAENSQVIITGVVADTSSFYHAMDFLVLPTHREGFPNVVLEAHAARKAVVTTRATGAEDSVVDGLTGILVPVADVDSLTSALSRLIRNPEEALKMGLAGYELANREYRQEAVWSAIEQQTIRMLKQRGLPYPKRIRNCDQPTSPPLGPVSA